MWSCLRIPCPRADTKYQLLALARNKLCHKDILDSTKAIGAPPVRNHKPTTTGTHRDRRQDRAAHFTSTSTSFFSFSFPLPPHLVCRLLNHPLDTTPSGHYCSHWHGWNVHRKTSIWIFPRPARPHKDILMPVSQPPQLMYVHSQQRFVQSRIDSFSACSR